MARRSKKAPPLTPDQKKARRALRKKLREENGSTPARRGVEITGWWANEAEELQFWLGIKARARASDILNAVKRRPYWLSHPKEDSGTSPRMTGFFPCSMFSRGDRWYYGFLFREHRDRCFRAWDDSRKELSGIEPKQ